MTTATISLPDALGAPAREFISGEHRLLIDGERVDAADGRTFATLDPASGREIVHVPHAGPQDVERAVAAARAAFSDGPWASMPAAGGERLKLALGGAGGERARGAGDSGWASMPAAGRERLMLALAAAVEERAEEIAQIESLDNGKPVGLAQYVDVAGSGAHLRYFGGWPTKIEGNVLPVSAPNMHCYTRREPVGVCGQIVPWNFPLLMTAWKIAPALAAGCTVVLKPAEQTPLSA